MNVLLLHNRSSGRGVNRALLDVVIARLNGEGHEVTDIEVGPGAEACDLAVLLAGREVLVIAGGDGTVHHSLPAAAVAGVPIYHLPMGTENLFAREFRMTRSAEQLAAALRAGKTRRVDVATAHGEMFVLMASVGFDACVVDRVAAGRRGGIKRTDYVAHIARELWRPRIAPLSVEVDGSALVVDRPGMVVVANSRQYGARLDPCRGADMSDGVLDVVFMPYWGRAGVMSWLSACALGVQGRRAGIVAARGRSVRIAAGGEKAMPYQLDGELAGSIGSLEIAIRPSALSVLLP